MSLPNLIVFWGNLHFGQILLLLLLFSVLEMYGFDDHNHVFKFVYTFFFQFARYFQIETNADYEHVTTAIPVA